MRVDPERDMIDRLRLARTDGVGPVAYRRLLRRFGSAAAALDALPGLARAGGRATPPEIPPPAVALREIERVRKLGARLLFLDRSDYPPLLALLDDAPPVIAVLGDASATAARSVAVVGSRNASANGQRIAESMAEELAAAGLVVVSGLARGIDAAAHAGALHAGRTVACVAGGIDVVYPSENAALQARIAAGGAVVAEAPPGTAPQARHFPRRNRIIAGLSLGVVVVEAAPRSGSLITARLAVEANRDVFAVPGSPLDPRCRGSNGLLREGAVLAETAADVLEHLREGISRSPLFARDAPQGPPRGLREPLAAIDEQPDMAPEELLQARSEVLGLLGPAPTAVDDLIRRCQFSAAAVMSVLLDLEIAGRVEALPGNRVALLGEPGV
ncbi:DNA-processing protein DprA [Limobrevibacterium gyesilva]|uniref:DNA-processing protein DprA n=1 Tax=Limobrevibacterium gyesilva TaxID=2991712 RepID=A0AA41YKZ0_9PROT|nr:DNA-processing protein DprA [Limobrevibacterium gyesilva]MCW3475701.1 DNA-processing protein DprA [Limobrevibacterium gyesilva]